MPKLSRTDQNRQQNQRPEQSTDKSLYKSREMSPTRRITSLVVGDALCFVIFTSLGADQHNEGFNLLYNLWIALPFLAGWFLVSPFIGAFRADIAFKPTKMVIRTLFAWLVTWPVAMGLRWLLVDRTQVPPTAFSSFLSFAIVALAFNTGLLLLWRWPFALNNDLRKRGI